MNWNERYRANFEKLKTEDINLAAEVLADLTKIKEDRDLSFGERKMLDVAQSIVNGTYKQQFESNVVRVDFKARRIA